MPGEASNIIPGYIKNINTIRSFSFVTADNINTIP